MHRVAPCNGEGGKGNGLEFFLIGGVFFLIDHMFNVSSKIGPVAEYCTCTTGL